jgi:L-asparaginase II
MDWCGALMLCSGEFCTELMTAGGGRVIGKLGAAGVYLCGIVGEGVACAVKIDDGTRGPQYTVTAAFLLWAARLLAPPSAPSDSDVTHGE